MTPVRYLDRLNKLLGRLDLLSSDIKPTDAEASEILEDLTKRLRGVLMMINRKGSEREKFVAEARGDNASRHA
jgi:hypothetical protein